jgi:cytochrome c-type biogenesis protein CcmE
MTNIASSSASYTYISWLTSDLLVTVALLVALVALVLFMLSRRISFFSFLPKRKEKKEKSKEGSVVPLVEQQDVNVPEFTSLPTKKKGLMEE